jgi:hypothetical protein
VVDGALEIIRRLKTYPNLDTETAVRQLRTGPSYLSELDYESAIELANNIGWDAFHLQSDRQRELSETLMEVVTRVKPNWAYLTPYGRDRVRKFINEDQEQCLKYAGLLDTPPSERVIQWWNQLASVFRSLKEAQNIGVGSEGEKLTIIYETSRLADLGFTENYPRLISIENNSAGYDVLSIDIDAAGNVYEIQIEVKATTTNQIRFIVTRNEWETACQNSTSYRFYIWKLGKESPAILFVDDLISHIPVDNGGGRWQDVELNLTDIQSNSR